MAITRDEAIEVWEQIKDPDKFDIMDDEAADMLHGLAEELIEAFTAGKCVCCQNNRPSGLCP